MRKHGFTLVELAIVIVIIGILAAVAIPAFVDLQTKAKENATRAGLGTIRSAIALSYADSLVNSPTPAWPTLVIVQGGTLFADNKVPTNPVASSATVVAACQAGAGWEYVFATHLADACSAAGAKLNY